MTTRLRNLTALFPSTDRGISSRDGEHWTNRAACIEHGLLFDLAYNYEPKKGAYHEKPSSAVGEAKAVCGRCDVIGDCLAEVMARPTRYGIWAGMTADERTNFARRRGRNRK